MSPALSPTEATQLVALRAMLSRASREARPGSLPDSGTALVLLDAVAERASHFAAVSLGIDVGRNDTVVKVYPRLKQQLPQWQKAAFPDIRQLHQARNIAQHEGLPPARELLPNWRTAVRTYVHSLVEATFGIELNEVRLGTAIADASLADALVMAEKVAEAGDYALCLTMAGSLFSAASRKWANSYAQRTGASVVPPRTNIADVAAFDYLRREIQAVKADLGLSMFADEPAEILWFRDAVRESQACNREDAERALGFIFWWLVAWERFDSTLVDRRRRSALAKRLVRTGQERAKIARVVDFSRYRQDTWECVLELHDVPDQSDYDDWRFALNELLSPQSRDVTVGDDGVVRRTNLRDDELEAWIVTVDRALAEADARASEIRGQREAAERKHADEQEVFETQLDAARDRLPPWVLKVSLQERPPDRRLAPTIALSPEARAVHGEQRGLCAVQEMLMRHPESGGCMETNNGLALGRSMPTETLLTILSDVDQQLSPRIGRGRDRPCGRPPAQIPACGTTALGSYLG